MKIYAYCRVSTIEQEILRQEVAIQEYTKQNNIKIDKWFCDKVTGKTFVREQYQTMKELTEKDDVIIIKELDRFGRSMELIKDEWNYYMKKGVRIVVVDMPLISSDLSGKKTLDMQFISNLVFEVLCYSAEKEREKISQRTKESLKAKKEQGIKLGRPNTYNIEEIKKLYSLGYTYKQITEKLGISKDRIYKIVKENGWSRR